MDRCDVPSRGTYSFSVSCPIIPATEYWTLHFTPFNLSIADLYIIILPSAELLYIKGY